ncbi:MAG TPA: hypothetical protein DD417_03920 [Elusimicrobia bacterium]|nr:hypothetical protein [Elusimicrobiota bacterium]
MDADVEVLEPRQEPRFRAEFRGPGSFGVLGALLAGGTALSAAGIVALLLFGRALLMAGLLTVMWPIVFSPEFTRWVFGAAALSFWKALLLCVLAEAVLRWLRRGLRN